MERGYDTPVALHQTYELYLDDVEDETRFVALTCPAGEVVSRARAVLEESQSTGCEVWQFGRQLFKLSAGAA